jgi:hypothetical protein
MDANRFDTLTRTLTGETRSRRRLLKGLTGGAVGAVAAVLDLTDTRAMHDGCRHVGKSCTRNGQCCSSRCRGPKGAETCWADNVGTYTIEKDVCLTTALGCGAGACVGFRATGGANFCSLPEAKCMTCSTDMECATALKVPGSACVDANHGLSCSCL